MKNFLTRAFAAACAALLAACAVPQIDRFMLETERVRLEGANGPLTRAQSEQILAKLRAASPDSAVLERHIAVEEALTGTPLTVGNKVTLLEDGPAAYRAMLAAIAGARSHVHMESYIFEADEVGRQFAEALVARRKAGVEVRLVYDGVGSLSTPKAFFQEMIDQGVDVVEFNPVKAANVLTQGLALQKRNHRKLTVVDGRVAFLGGINISGVYAPGGLRSQRGGIGGSAGESDGKPFDEQPWRDTQVRIEGPVVEDFQRGFLRIWARVKKEEVSQDKRYFPKLANAGPHVVRAVESTPGDGASALYVTLISAIESAESEVRITMAYFVPHEQLLAALVQAARRGVKVHLLLPSRTDNWLVLHAGRSYYDEMLAAGVRIYERKRRLLHSKTATIDGVWSTVGSTNLDWRSLVYNDEV
ncbi:MAG TPA: phospholipase D-like domain-containing protein, partial [Usitatibacter sp.]|nr:phospholipase D-like domain-containing protein [Usitatibacter sp.]